MPTKKTRRVRARTATTPGRNGNQQTETCPLPQATQQFLQKWTPLWGPSLKSRVVSALGDTKARTQGELVKDLQDGVPDELALEGDNGKRGLVKLALIELENQSWIIRAGQSDSDRVRLVLADPDPNFEIDPIFSTAVPAVKEFLAEGAFRLKERFTNNNGLTVMERI